MIYTSQDKMYLSYVANLIGSNKEKQVTNNLLTLDRSIMIINALVDHTHSHSI